MNKEDHKKQIIAQFTNQAAGYTAIASHSDALDKLIKIVSPKTEESVLDVACGSGIVSLAFAKQALHVTGVDITEEMLREAKKCQQQQEIVNVEWVIGEADALPFPDNTFSVVVTRFSFHHFIDPEAVLREMIRVCRPGGAVMVTDVAVPEACTLKYDQMEKLRDPSHVAVLSIPQFKELFETSGLKNIRGDNYKMEIDLEQQLHASFPTNENALKHMIMGDVEKDQLGIAVTQIEERFSLFYPVYILAGNKL